MAGHELLFNTINFALLVGALVYIGRKPVSAFFQERSAEIRKGLDEGRKALEAAQAEVRAADEKLAHLEAEIAALKNQAVSEMKAERERLRQAAQEEAARIGSFASAQIEAAARAARVELKRFTGEQAVALAGESIRGRLDQAGERRLFASFLTDLEAERRKN